MAKKAITGGKKATGGAGSGPSLFSFGPSPAGQDTKARDAALAKTKPVAKPQPIKGTSMTDKGQSLPIQPKPPTASQHPVSSKPAPVEAARPMDKQKSAATIMAGNSLSGSPFPTKTPTSVPKPIAQPSQKPAIEITSGTTKAPVSYDEIVRRFSFVALERPNKEPVNVPVPLAPSTFQNYLLLNVEYDRDSNKALMRFYDPVAKRIYFLTDPTGHEPYCLSRRPKAELEANPQLTSIDGFKRIEVVKKRDLLRNQDLDFSKIIGTTPLTIASGNPSIKDVYPDVLEANIRYHLNYIADRHLVPGLYYSFKNGVLVLDQIPLADDVRKEIDELMKNERPEYKQFFTEYFEYFVPEVPDIPRAAIDLEIYQATTDKYPDPGEARDPIIAASVVASDGRNEVLVWKGHKLFDIGKWHDDFPSSLKVRVFESEAELIRELFRLIWRYPIIITFNGDEFDLRYLYNRSRNKKIAISDDENPIKMERGIGVSKNSAFLKYGLHLDLYQFFRNRSIQGYALGGAYTEHSLDAVSQGLLGEKKFAFEGGISELSFLDLVYYNWRDGMLTLELTRFKSNLTLNLVITLMRICRLPMNEIVRTWVSAWVKQLLVWEHRKRGYVVPNQSDIQARDVKRDKLVASQLIADDQDAEAEAEADEDDELGGKRFEGAFVLDPKPGVYFDVIVMDFSSLYPSIIKEWNLSYETINCSCKSCTKRQVPGMPHVVCGDRIGIMSLVTGVIRDLRVLYFKPKAKKNPFYNVLQAALKVLINASYGVYGAETFALYCLPVAESTTAIGRYSIKNTIEKATSIGATVLYGDSDSVFLINPGPDKVKILSAWADKELHLELDVDKAYKFLALSSRKKNYLGVFKNGEIDIKGLVGKKSNTPAFIRDAFFQFTEIIKDIAGEEDFKARKESIKAFIRQCWSRIKKNQFPLESYAIKVQLQSKIVKQITDPNPPTLKIQHLMAARELYQLKKVKFEAGQSFAFVKVKSGAKALELAHLDEIDRDKYMDLFKSTFEQVLDALGISFTEIIGIKKLDSFF
ncbi:MAG: DNA-directed DNA polymerase I [Candidatus Sigynarchaeum springense]